MQNKSAKKILHITPHLGGGVGRVLLDYLSRAKENSSFVHKIVCLDYANKNASDLLKNMNLELSSKMAGKKRLLLNMIAKSDIVLVHWWNHPLLYDFLVRTELPPCRLIMWSHTSGFNPPAVFTKKILTYPDRFVFVTPISLETKEAKNISKKQKENLRVVLATCDIKHIESLKPKKHAGFNVGYVGTVDYAKIYLHFLSICDKIKIPNVKFIVCGGSNEKEFGREAKEMGIAQKFKFTSLVSDITRYLSIFDVFGYPLSPKHYGACDQVLIESMAAGVVPVVLNNRMEKYMVKDGVVGVVAKNETEYIKAIEKLYKDRILRNALSKNAREYAIKTFSVNRTVEDWEKIFKEILVASKTPKKWHTTKKTVNISSADVFLESLGKYGKNFGLYLKAKKSSDKRFIEQKIRKMAESPGWQAKTRSTAHHYSSFFPKDRNLSAWSKLTKGN